MTPIFNVLVGAKMLNVIMLSVILLNVVAPSKLAKKMKF